MSFFRPISGGGGSSTNGQMGHSKGGSGFTGGTMCHEFGTFTPNFGILKEHLVERLGWAVLTWLVSVVLSCLFPGAQGNIVPNNAMGSANVTVNVDASGSSVEGNSDQAAQLGRMLGAAVQAELVKQKRPGGLLAS